MQRTFTVGAVSIVPLRDDIEATYKIIEESVKAHPEADMLCFGELFLTQDKDDLIDPNKSARYETIVAQIKRAVRNVRYSRQLRHDLKRR